MTIEILDFRLNTYCRRIDRLVWWRSDTIIIIRIRGIDKK